MVEKSGDNIGDVDQSKWVAIVGMSCRFPKADSLDEYWELLVNGENTCSTVPEYRRKLVDMDPTINGNFLKCPIDQFDASFFGFSPTEASFTDPQARLLLEVSWEALENAGINPDRLRGTKTGVFHGSWIQEYKEAMNENCSEPSQDFLRKYLGNAFGSTAAKLSFFYGMTGPNVATESGCSSSMVAIDIAYKSLQRKECTMALACGANLILHMNKQNIVWAEDGKSKTFDVGANGYARGEGIAVMVLKNYSDAILDNDNIHGIIRGVGTSQEGLSKSFGTPTIQSEYDSMREALVAANVTPTQVDYLEAHATGTAVGDPIESAAIVKAYDSGSTVRETPLIIGSGKTNLGHTESCSGMAGLIKVLLSMKHELIPKHINFTKLNPQIDFTSIPGVIPVESIPWPRKSNERPRIAGVSSFGITGTDVHVIVQEPPIKEEIQNENCSSQAQILTLSAKSNIALEQMTNQFLTHLEASTNQQDIQDITFTSNVCRAHLPFRRSIVASDKAEMVKNIREGLHTYTSSNEISSSRNICFTFPGLIGKMSLEPIRELYETVPYFKETMDSCDIIFKQVITNSGSLVDMLVKNPVESRNAPKGAEWYGMLACYHLSLSKLWMKWGIVPKLVLGHCFGEFSAAVVSGALNLKDALEIVKTIPHFLHSQATEPASMIAVKCDQQAVEKLIQEFLQNNKTDSQTSWIDVGVVNSKFQTVVVGPPVTISAFQEYCAKNEIKSQNIPSDFCPHSRAIETACQKALEVFNKVIHNPIKIPYISSLTGGLVKDSDLNGDFWYRMLRNCVNYKEACSSAANTQLADIFLEIGLDSSLTNFTRANLENNQTCLASFPRKDYGIYNSLAEMYALGINVNWENFHSSGKRNKVSLPHYPFQRKSFWYERKSRARSVMPANDSRPVVHPFLGSDMDVPPGDFAYFRNDNFLCEDQQTKFVDDHVIGDKVIFPGAGFLEMILSAWKLAMKLENISEYSVEKFTVHQALLLDKAIPVSIVSVVNKSNGNVSIYTTNGTGQQWRLHATAEIILGKSKDQKEQSMGNIINTLICNEESEERANEFYLNVSKVGLNFGPDFKSLKNIHTTVNGDTVAEVGNLSQSSDCFSCHPVLIDAMIQGYMVHTKPNMTKLHVPVKMGKFDLVSPSHLSGDGKYYVYCQNGSTTVSLLDQSGQVVVVMRSPELVATTVEKVLAAAAVNKYEGLDKNNSTNSVNMYDAYWKKAKAYQPSATFKDVIESKLEYENELSDFQRKQTILNALSEEEVHFDETMNRLCSLYVVKALFNIGCVQEQRLDLFKRDTSAVDEKWGILPGLVKAFHHFISYLDGNKEYLKTTSLEQVEYEIKSILDLPQIKGYSAMRTIHECGWNLAEILKGNLSTQEILFGERNLAENFYQTSRLYVKSQQSQEKLFTLIVSKLETALKSRQQSLKILEVGGGTGAFPKMVIPLLKKMGVEFHYHFTDISRALVSKAKETFEVDSKNFTFKPLNIEMDPLKQGFPPGYFDIVVAVDVLHETKNLNDSLKNIQMVTKLGGVLLLGETEKPVKEVDICFGGLEGYWIFEDNIRKNHCTINSETWIQVMAGNGFSGNPCRVLSCGSQFSVISASKTNEMTAEQGASGEWAVFEFENGAFSEYKFLLESLTNRSYKTYFLDRSMRGEQLQKYINDHVQGNLEGILIWMCPSTSIDYNPISEESLEPLLYISKYLQQVKGKAALPKLHLVTGNCWDLPPPMNLSEINLQGPSVAQAWGFLRCARIELPGISSKSIDLEMSSETNDKVAQLVTEMWLDDKETEVVYRKGMRHVNRLKEQTTKLFNIPIPNAEMFHVELPKSKAIRDIKFVETCGVEDLEEHQVRIEVRSVALNFKDVFAVLKPSWEFEHLTSIGLDFSGVVTQVGKNVERWHVGDAVFGFTGDQRCMRSHLITNDNLLMAIPPSMTFAEASTLPTVFATTWHCMVDVAKLQRGQTMLLHAASGGVGLAAIQIAKVLGVSVIGTAGSEKKRRFVRRLGVEHVFNSRTTDFKNEITKVTGGKGVDMVLNCLTGPGFKEASLSLCRDGGHFVEISKLDIWSEKEVQDMRPLVNYSIVDLTQVDELVLEPILEKLSELLMQGSIRSLHYKAYPANCLNHALSYLQKAKHIGKVVVNMPSLVSGERKTCIFNDRSTYMITGGKTGIGFAVCKWMVIEHGAKYVVLVSRSPAQEILKRDILELENDYGATIVCKEVDISDYSQCETLIKHDLKDLPPLRGVHHCAAVLSDQLLSKDDWSNFERVINPKAGGAWNLHQLTMNTPLEHFVLYSSAVSVFGNVGQTNYACANSYLDNLAALRTSMGLPVLSINWGQWNTGMAVDLEIPSFKPFSIEEGIQALDYFMQSSYEQQNPIVAGKILFDGLLKLSPWFKNSLLEDIVMTPSFLGENKSSSDVASSLVKDDKVCLGSELKECGDDKNLKQTVVRSFVLQMLCDTLGTAKEEIKDDVMFADMGMDSIMSIEFTNKMNSELENNIEGEFSIQLDLEENGTLEKLSEFLLEALEQVNNVK